jgi:hypothetical protein
MTHEELAEKLLTPLWRGIPVEYKAKYARTIWEQFENNIRNAAYTARLPQFLQNIKARLDLSITEARVAGVIEIISDEAQARKILKMLREDTTLLVLFVRAANEERREAFVATGKNNSPLPAEKKK